MNNIAYRREYGKPAGHHWIADLAHSESAYLTLEPGDATRYELFITCIEAIDRVLIINMTHNIAMTFFRRLVHPDQIHLIENKCTRHLMADVINIYLTGVSGVYYDWEKACPILE